MNDPMLGPIDQIGYVVADLDRSIARWRKRHDVGPWTVFRNVRLDGLPSRRTRHGRDGRRKPRIAAICRSN